MTNGIVDLMYQIAAEAMTIGLDLSLEQKQYTHKAKGIGPNIGGGHTEDTGVILRVWQPEKESEQEQDPEEEDESND